MPTEDYDSQELGSTFPGIHMLRMLSLACGIIAIALTALAAKQFFRFGQALGVTSEGKLSPGLWLALLDVAGLAFVGATLITIVHYRRWLIGLAFALLALPYLLMTTATFFGAAASDCVGLLLSEAQCIDVRVHGLASLIGESPMRIQLLLVAHQAVLITITKVLFVFLAITLWPRRSRDLGANSLKATMASVDTAASCYVCPNIGARSRTIFFVVFAKAPSAAPDVFATMRRPPVALTHAPAVYALISPSKASAAKARGPPTVRLMSGARHPFQPL